jgi:hypothetical protein
MRDIAEILHLYPARCREIEDLAQSFFDRGERANLLEFISEYELMAQRLMARDARVVVPLRPLTLDRQIE